MAQALPRRSCCDTAVNEHHRDDCDIAKSIQDYHRGPALPEFVWLSDATPCPLCQREMNEHTVLSEPTGRFRSGFGGEKQLEVRPTGWRCPT